MSVENLVKLHKVDGDPRKMIAVRHLVNKYPDAIAYWHKSGIDERVTGTSKHKHGVLGHMFGGALAAEAIGEMLNERGVLTEVQVEEMVRAFLVHDADKTTDMKFTLWPKVAKKVMMKLAG